MHSTWALSPDLDLRLRCWEDECIAYIGASGDTHCLSALTGEMLVLLQKNPMDTAQLVQHFADIDNSAEDFLPYCESILSELQQLGIVQACQR